MDENPSQWSYKLEGVLFAHRVSPHLSTKHSPFYLMYNQEPVLPGDLNNGLNSEPVDLCKLFNQDMFKTVLSTDLCKLFDQNMSKSVFSTANAIRDDIHEAAGRNIKKIQVKQKRDFERRYLSSSTVNVGKKVLLKTTGEMLRRVVNLPIAG